MARTVVKIDPITSAILAAARTAQAFMKPGRQADQD
jgi:hypothetical protein